jgi:hypothetical protein
MQWGPNQIVQFMDGVVAELEFTQAKERARPVIKRWLDQAGFHYREAAQDQVRNQLELGLPPGPERLLVELYGLIMSHDRHTAEQAREEIRAEIHSPDILEKFDGIDRFVEDMGDANAAKMTAMMCKALDVNNIEDLDFLDLGEGRRKEELDWDPSQGKPLVRPMGTKDLQEGQVVMEAPIMQGEVEGCRFIALQSRDGKVQLFVERDSLDNAYWTPVGDTIVSTTHCSGLLEQGGGSPLGYLQLYELCHGGRTTRSHWGDATPCYEQLASTDSPGVKSASKR